MDKVNRKQLHTGILWRIEKKTDMSAAINSYLEKFGTRPTLAYAKSGTIKDIFGVATHSFGVRLAVDRQVPKGHIWFPIEGK